MGEGVAMSVTKSLVSCTVALCAALTAPSASAVTFDIDYGDGISGTLNTMMTVGAGVRMQNRSSDLVGKANLNPAVCGGIAQSCQGVFRDQHLPARTLAASPGQAYLNADDGNWNYDRHDFTQAVFKVTQDLNLSYGEFGLFAKWLYFYDFVNNDFMEFHPNWITAANRGSVGCDADDDPCMNVTNYDRAYGPGAPMRVRRSDGEVLRQIGTDLQMMDYYIYGQTALPFFEDKTLTWKVGNQTLNWGESTALVINSVNQVNAVNANNLLRVGFDLSELYVPSGMVFGSVEPFENATIEAFYGYEWKPLEIPAPGSYFSFADVGTNNAVDYASISFGGPAEDPEVCGTGSASPSETVYGNPASGCGSPLNNPLSGLTNTSTTIRRIDDNEARDDGQYGVSFKYFAEWLNNGTELAFYFMNYHSKLPYVSEYATVAACTRAEGNDLGIDATNGLELLSACRDLPVSDTTAVAARTATSNAVPIDTVKFQLEYPEDLKMFGVSFNTTIGDISLQGEIAYRPDSPLQVDTQDLTFHALGPMLARCHNVDTCTGTTGGTSTVDSVAYQSSDFDPYPGTQYDDGLPHTDTFDLAVGAAVGSARSFPSFIGAYRGVAPGETPAYVPGSPYNSRNPAYIQGWEEFDVWQFNLGATYVQGATDNVIGADQLIWLFEWGVQWVPDLPDTDVLQIEAPGTHYHASAGADGSGTGNWSQDCAHTVDCHYSGVRSDGSTFGAPGVNGTYGDGLRFNPHQQDPDDYADDFSTGIVIVSLIRYESVFPGISFAPFTLFQYDVKGTSTDAAAQFTEGRMDIAFLFEVRYKESLSFTPGYTWFTGGGAANLHRDRDQATVALKYLF